MEESRLNSIDILEYFGILIKWRKFIIVNIVVVAIIAGGISFLLPKWYRATTTLLPPKEQTSMGSLSMAGTLLKSVTGGSKTGKLGQMEGQYNIIAVLESRSAMETVIDHFDLLHVYNISDNSMEKAIKELKENTSFELQADDYISIDVLDTDPKRAAEMANYFVKVLNDITIRMGTQEARSNREFIEKAVALNKQKLYEAEEKFKIFQENSKIKINPDATSVSGITSIAELYGLKVKKEIEVNILARTASSDNALLRNTKIELDEINRKVDQIPEAGISSIRLFRDVVVLQKILEYLVPLLEQAKVDENKDVPAMVVLDQAVPPEKKEKPKKAMIILYASISSFLMSCIYVLISEKLHCFKRDFPDRYALIQQKLHLNI
jgi:tyrosine-protein kinase Etk/Wzc